MRNHIRYLSIILLMVTGSVVAVGVTGSPIGATPLDDARAQAKAIQDQIDATGQRIGALAEEYNGAQLAFDQAEQTIATSQAGIAAAQAQVARIKALVDERSASVYRRVLAGQSLDEFAVSDAAQLLTRRKYAATQAARDARLLTQLDDAKAKLAKQEAVAEHARAAADAERQQLAATKHDLEATNAQQQQALGQVQGQLAALVQQEAERRAAAALATAQARFAPGSRDSGHPEQFPNLPPPGPAAATAIEFARAQLGKPYVYAAAGPDAYDCSGLTMASYRAAGVALPHYSGAQYAALPHVSLDAMEPGDLLFWGTNASYHVAIYLGAGRILEAAGANVHIGPIWGHPMGAARPS